MLKNHRRRPGRRLSALALMSGLTLASQIIPIEVAEAGEAAGFWTRSSRVDTTVDVLPGGLFEYNYKVVNTSRRSIDGEQFGEPVIVDWELPYFDDYGIDLNDARHLAGRLGRGHRDHRHAQTGNRLGRDRQLAGSGRRLLFRCRQSLYHGHPGAALVQPVFCRQ